MTEQQINYLIRLHTGQWFGFNGKQTYENLWVDGFDKPTIEEIDTGIAQLKNAQKEREAEQEARDIAIEEIIAERTQQALDNVKSEIALGKIEDARKAVRDEHKKLKG